MYYTDYHSHSILSPDGRVPLSEMADAALAAGIDELCITDHYDLQAEHGGRNPAYDWGPAIAQYQEAATRYAGRLVIRLGLELGGAPVDPAYCEALLDQAELDFVIGSLHNMSPSAGGVDFYYQDYSDQAVCHRALDDYFASMEALAARPGLYDSLGHIIYPLRYMPPTVTLERYMGRIEGILKEVTASGRGIEVNTYRGKSIGEWRPILECYRAVGGTLVTVGADAHAPEGVGRGVREAYGLLRELGFRQVATYKKRQPILHDL